MTISFDLPPDVESELDSLFENIGQAAKEAFVIQGYRNRQFGISMVRRLLDLETRWDAEQWLSDHGVCSNYSADDLADDRQTLRNVFGHDV
ncbi:MAG: UPF0175 family protein [Phycisphaeraceae bacterium]